MKYILAEAREFINDVKPDNEEGERNTQKSIVLTRERFINLFDFWKIMIIQSKWNHLTYVKIIYMTPTPTHTNSL